MIEEILAMLDTLDGNLRSLWEIYLGKQPNGWLSDVEHIRARLTEMLHFHDELEYLRGNLSDIRRHVSESSHLDSIRKEN